MKHAILGAGGVGGTIGAILAAAGDEIILVVRPGTGNQYPGEISLESKYGKASGPVTVTESLATAVDALWVTPKATQLASALDGVQASATARAVVPLLNGVDHVRLLRERFGHDAVVPATIAGEMERIAPGKYIHPSPFLRLNLAASGRDRLETPVEHLRLFGVECKFIESEATLLWSKMVFLAPIALSTSAFNEPIGGVRDNATAKQVLEDAVHEAVRAGKANGADVNVETPLSLIASSPGGMRSSMQKDVAAGRPPELDAIAGPILRAGREHHFPTPATEDLVRRIEQRTRS